MGEVKLQQEKISALSRFRHMSSTLNSSLNHEKMLKKHSNRIWLKEKNNVWRMLRLSLATSFFKDKLEHNDIKSTITSSALTIIIRESKLNYRKNSNSKTMDTSYSNYNDTRNQS